MTAASWDNLLVAETFDPGVEADLLLNTLAWCATAAGVAGLIIVGTLLALQLDRGEPGAEAHHFKGLVYVVGASVMAATAGPLVSFLGPFSL